MVSELFSSFEFFLPQIVFGVFLGCLLSFLGSFLVLRNLAFLGITLSQVVTSGVAISLFLGIEGVGFPIGISLLVLIPLLAFQKNERKHQDTLLGILFVFSASFSQFLLSLGGNVKNQIMAAFFGDILTNRAESLQEAIWILGLSFLLFFLFFRKFLFLAWDRDEFLVRGNSILRYESLFYGIAVVVLSISVHMLGSFYATAHLLVPSYAALAFVRSIRGLLGLAAVLSGIATLVGFWVSLIGWEVGTEVVYFPTSSTIVVLLVVLGLLLRLGRKAL